MSHIPTFVHRSIQFPSVDWSPVVYWGEGVITVRAPLLISVILTILKESVMQRVCTLSEVFLHQSANRLVETKRLLNIPPFFIFLLPYHHLSHPT